MAVKFAQAFDQFGIVVSSQNNFSRSRVRLISRELLPIAQKHVAISSMIVKTVIEIVGDALAIVPSARIRSWLAMTCCWVSRNSAMRFPDRQSVAEARRCAGPPGAPDLRYKVGSADRDRERLRRFSIRNHLTGRPAWRGIRSRRRQAPRVLLRGWWRRLNTITGAGASSSVSPLA